MNIFGAQLAIRTIAMIAAIAALMLLAGPAACNKIRSMGAQAKVNGAQSNAFVNSAGDAVETIGNANSRERSSDDLTATNSKEIHDAPGAKVQVDPAVDNAGLRSLCRRAAYRDSERCKLHNPLAQ